jgi:hypothetical protein
MSKAKWLSMVATIAPMILMYTPLAPLAQYVGPGIQEAELIPGASGTDKLSHVISIVRNGIAATNAQAGRVVIDPQLSDTVIASGVGTVVSVVNLVHASHANDTPVNTHGPVAVAALKADAALAAPTGPGSAN